MSENKKPKKDDLTQQDNGMPSEPAGGVEVTTLDNGMPIGLDLSDLETKDNGMPAPPALDLERDGK
ncbi:hypothetical protein ACIQNG_15350 [Streptomyces sp. NPDC091377]|uniref:hypothetical protein n=1 Tax=unclassified Streptomyces TaxID=2593676 RepID=UPI003801ECAE